MGTFTLSLEQLDKRDMPSASALGAKPPLYAEEMRVVIPEGCWPGPQPVLVKDYGSIIPIGGTSDTVAVKVTSAIPPEPMVDAGQKVLVGH